MEILDTLHEITLQKYPIGIECFDGDYDLDPRLLEVTLVIKDKRNEFSLEEVCENLRKNFNV